MVTPAATSLLTLSIASDSFFSLLALRISITVCVCVCVCVCVAWKGPKAERRAGCPRHEARVQLVGRTHRLRQHNNSPKIAPTGPVVSSGLSSMLSASAKSTSSISTASASTSSAMVRKTARAAGCCQERGEIGRRRGVKKIKIAAEDPAQSDAGNSEDDWTRRGQPPKLSVRRLVDSGRK